MTDSGIPGRTSADLDRMLATCIHCGLCLEACPTYRVTGNEAESPRGRLVVMRDLLSRDALVERTPLDHCMGCRGCETACPSGVPYGSLLQDARTRLGPKASATGRWMTQWIDGVLSDPRRLFVLDRLGRVARRLGLARWLPDFLATPLRSLPRRPSRWPTRAGLPARGDVALLPGCGQWAYTPEVLASVAKLVRAAGKQPFVPRGIGCCGALSHHGGSLDAARQRLRSLMDAVGETAPLIVASAGCSAHLRHGEELFAPEDPLYARAAGLARRCIDFVEWMDEEGQDLRFQGNGERVVYHPPCHHTHAQGIVDPPVRTLQRVDAIELVEMADAQSCCGSAGSYSIEHPDLAGQVRDLKIASVSAANPDVLLTANPGCELFLDAGLGSETGPPRVEHLAVFLAARLRPDRGLGAG